MVSGLTHHLRCTGDELRKLFSKQYEDDAIVGELDKVPNRAAPNPGDGKRLAAPFDVAHGDAGRDGGENAGAMQMLGQKVGTKRDQQADQDLRTGLLAEMPRYPILRDGRNPGDAYAYGDTADRQPTERCARVGAL